ncbi:MAG: nucleotidyltransferase domain-containing protein [Desulfobacterales bacterium]|nr:nucleotidyltransferase domain-containing protein [Desulfobacterales bacterium]
MTTNGSQKPATQPDLTIDSIKHLLEPVLRKYGIQKAILFGSYSRGVQSRKSDIDLILIQETDRRYFDRYEGVLKEMQDQIPGRDLEVLIYTPEELKRISHRRFIQDAVQHGRVIYEC